MNLTVEERFYGTDELFGADEAFLTGTTTEVLSIVRVNDKVIGSGKVGPVADRLGKGLREWGAEGR
jgi:branched-subunit amino acid aminotransferase/4-amino-4-deoxychorismate lyase